MEQMKDIPATLALADGQIFKGISVGMEGESSGEVVFNTSLSGYQEILTDPSYCNQMLTFTCPHIGNVGVNKEDVESNKVQVSGMIVREFSDYVSNYRAEASLGKYLCDEKIVAISGIDTRKLVLHLRDNGSQMGVIATGKVNDAELVAKAKALPSMEGQDLVKRVTTKTPYKWQQGVWSPGVGYRNYSDAEVAKWPLVVAMDFGIKHNILRLLVNEGFRVLVVPAQTSAEEILKSEPAGVFLSNGPGDPAVVDYAIKTVKTLLGKQPIFGICLGHQILGHALGAKTFKLKFGHRGGNHPVRDKVTCKVEITVQNHGFAIDAESVPAGIDVSHLNLNDKTVEGFSVPEKMAFSIQYHPESSPGPHDARYLFSRFGEMVKKYVAEKK